MTRPHCCSAFGSGVIRSDEPGRSTELLFVVHWRSNITGRATLLDDCPSLESLPVSRPLPGATRLAIRIADDANAPGFIAMAQVKIFIALLFKAWVHILAKRITGVFCRAMPVTTVFLISIIWR